MDHYPLHYLALGDSLTFGIGVPAFDDGFVERYACLSQQTLKRRIQYKKHTWPGATTKDVLSMLSSPTVIEAMKSANIITLTAGGNDLINAAKKFAQNRHEKLITDALEQTQNNYIKIIEKIHNVEKQKEFIIRLMNLYNPFPEIAVADQGVQMFNSLMKRFSADKHVKVADVYPIFKGNERELLSKGGIHPNRMGYERMASAFHALGYFPLNRHLAP